MLSLYLLLNLFLHCPLNRKLVALPACSRTRSSRTANSSLCPPAKLGQLESLVACKQTSVHREHAHSDRSHPTICDPSQRSPSRERKAQHKLDRRHATRKTLPHQE